MPREEHQITIFAFDINERCEEQYLRLRVSEAFAVFSLKINIKHI
jgi:hypothetical protein